MQALKITLLIYLLLPLTAFAGITIDPGEYRVNALLNIKGDHIEMVFNMMSASEIRVELEGKKMVELRKNIMQPTARHLVFNIEKKTTSLSKLKAKLISFRKLKSKEKVPQYVGNNFIPLKN